MTTYEQALSTHRPAGRALRVELYQDSPTPAALGSVEVWNGREPVGPRTVGELGALARAQGASSGRVLWTLSDGASTLAADETDTETPPPSPAKAALGLAGVVGVAALIGAAALGGLYLYDQKDVNKRAKGRQRVYKGKTVAQWDNEYEARMAEANRLADAGDMTASQAMFDKAMTAQRNAIAGFKGG